MALAEFTTIYMHDGLSRLTERSTPRGLPGQNLAPAVERYFYDSVGNLERVESPRQDVSGHPFTTIYSYDPNALNNRAAVRLRTKIGNSNSGSTTRNLAKYVDPRGEDDATLYTFDAANSLVETFYAAGGELAGHFIFLPTMFLPPSSRISHSRSKGLRTPLAPRCSTCV